ncbi:MAG: BatA domain-containing protein, partial [Alphaproteobacteria bacterium]
MLSIGTIAFAAPWALVALIGLPVLWWLLRVTPPAPRLLRFPAIRLLFGLRQDEQTPARTPF